MKIRRNPVFSFLAIALLLIEFECELREQDTFTTHVSGLPDDWWSIPNNQSMATRAVGNTWLDARGHLAMQVPSAAVPSSLTLASGANILLNPTHRKFPALREGGRCIEHPFDLTHYLGLPRPEAVFLNAEICGRSPGIRGRQWAQAFL